jgi:hypothetical protein
MDVQALIDEQNNIISNQNHGVDLAIEEDLGLSNDHNLLE